MKSGLPYIAKAFGFCWRSDIPLDGFDACTLADVNLPTIDVLAWKTLPHRSGGRQINRGYAYSDGFRIVWEDEVTFDMTDGSRIAYAQGTGWAGVMPVSFYSTVAALTVAWRGMVPLHACAVEVDGKAVLIAGPSGAGKSTLTAGLILAGSRFLADDLTVVSVRANGQMRIAPGRPTMRLHPHTAARLDTVECHPVVGDPRGKWLVRPGRRTEDLLDLGSILLLGSTATPGTAAPAVDLFDHLFRPRWIEALPNHKSLMADVLSIAAHVPMINFAVGTNFGENSLERVADEALAIVRASFRVIPR